MPDADRIEAYASALFEVAQGEGNLPTVEDELFKVGQALEHHDLLRTTLANNEYSVETRQSIVEEVLGTAEASPTTIALVSFVVGSGRAHDLPAIVDRLVAKAAESRAESVAEVRSAIPLDADHQRRLGAALSHRMGHTVAVKVIVDPSILGGLVAQIGDTVIDGSVRSRLNQLRSSL